MSTVTPNVNDHAPWAPTFINKYLEAQLDRFGLLQDGISPFIPVGPNAIDDVYKEFIGAGLPTILLYERLSRFRAGAFYRNKREQVMYNITGTFENVMAASRIITAALDREDASGEDVNKWLVSNWDSSTTPHNIYFHRFKAFQVDETRDLLELSSVKTLYKAKVIVEYDYHTKDPIAAFYD